MIRAVRAGSVVPWGVLLAVISFVFSTAVGAAGVPDRSAGRDLAEQIMEATKLKGGVIVHFGCGDGKLTAAMWTGESFLVHGLDADAENVGRAQAHIRSLGLCGKVSVQQWAEEGLPYADNLVNLVVAEDLGELPMAEVMRVLCPCGVARIKKDGRWVQTTKPWPEGIDEWTHWLHGPDGNAVARDRVVGPPRRLQWMARPSWARLHDAPSTTSAMVSSGGRVFYIGDEGPAGVYQRIEDRWFLTARDAFNGVLLWKRPMPDWGWKQWTVNWHTRNNQPFQLPKRLVAVGNTVYVTLAFNGPLSALDAATGEIVRTYDATEYTDEILVHDGLLILALNRTAHRPAEDNHQPLKQCIAAVKADTGEILWKSGDYTGLLAKSDSIEPVGRLEMAAGDGRVFFCDHHALVALDLRSGREIWRTPRPDGPKLPANFGSRMYELSVLVYNDGVVLFAQPEGTTSFHSVPGTLYALAAEDGRLLWKHRYGGWVHNTQPNVFAIDKTVWIHEHQEGDVRSGRRMVFPIELQEKADYAVLGLDLHTGQQRHRFATREIFNVGHHHRCYRNKSTERFLLTSRRGVEFLQTDGGELDLNHWVRGDCHLGVMPCNGLLYTTPHPCSCYIDTKLNGYYCLAPQSTTEKSPRTPQRDRLEKGPAYGEISILKSEDPHADWPTFRADAKRSGSTKTPVPGTLDRCWETAVGRRIGPLSLADGKVFVPVVDEHRVVALQATTGNPVWDFTADGRVDTPPTIFQGLVLFGSADGCVYCLRCSRGRLAWKRRIAPRQRLISAMSRLESAWPVHGSVLVTDGIAYLAAGRSSYLDGGIHLVSLRPETGEILEQRVVYSPDPQTDKMPPGDAFTIPGMLADVLVSDGASVWMRRNKVFGDRETSQGPLFATGGFRDDSWFNRTTWAVGNARHAQLLVFDESVAYGIEAYPSSGRAKAFQPGEKGYRLFAKSLTSSGSTKQGDRKGEGKSKQRKGIGKAAGGPDLWSIQVPVRGTAMALAGDTLLLAGAPDVVDANDPLGAFEGRQGAVLYALAAVDGKKLSEYKLEALPVFDGMAAANGRLYLATKSGRVLCLGGKP